MHNKLLKLILAIAMIIPMITIPKQVKAETNVNLALGKTAVSSSNEVDDFGAANVTDDDQTTRWASGVNDGPHWVYVDLGQEQTIKEVKIFWETRKATNYEIQVSNDAEIWETAATLTERPATKNDTITLSEAKIARYVRLQITSFTALDPDSTLSWNNVSLYELQVYANETRNNLAYKKTAVSSSDEANTLVASKAVDGSTTKSRWASAVGDGPHWIYVDLGKTHNIDAVKVFWETRKATNYEIQVSNDGTNWTTAASLTDHPTSKNDLITLNNPVSARYVKLVINSFTALDPDSSLSWNNISLYELEVYEAQIDETIEGDNLALQKPANASSVEADHLPATNAVDGNASSRWSSNVGSGPHSIYVDLQQSAQIDAIKILWETRKATNYEIQVSNDAENWTTAASYADRPSSKDETIYLAEAVEGRYVRLLINSITATDPDGGVEWNTISVYEFGVYGKYTYSNVALNKEVNAYWTADDTACHVNSDRPITNIVDGNKTNLENHTDFGLDNTNVSSYVELDLEEDTYINSINLYRYWGDNRTYRNTVIALSDDPYFMNPTIIYNTDTVNIHGYGMGDDETYAETSSGKTFSNINISARYVRVYMNGISDDRTTNHIVELEVMGKTTAPTQLSEDIVYLEKNNTQSGDYLFEGYYSDEQGTSKITREAFFADGGYAKYVTPEVLTVMAQTKLNGTDKIDARFFTSVASLDPQTVKFKIERTINGVTSSKETESHIVYETINSDFGETVSNAGELFENSASAYFSAVKLNNIPADYTGTITVTPYWLPYGTTKYIQGTPRTFTISGNTLEEVSE